jgi:hypothetical protein
MFALLCFVLAVLASPFKSKSRLEAENVALRHLCVPRTSSALISRRNHLTSVHNVCTALLRPGRLDVNNLTNDVHSLAKADFIL